MPEICRWEALHPPIFSSLKERWSKAKHAATFEDVSKERSLVLDTRSSSNIDVKEWNTLIVRAGVAYRCNSGSSLHLLLSACNMW